MEFNFGSRPFKFAVPQNFIAINQAPSNCVSSNTTGTMTPAPDRLVANAPQALIIEVKSPYFPVFAKLLCNKIDCRHILLIVIFFKNV